MLLDYDDGAAGTTQVVPREIGQMRIIRLSSGNGARPRQVHGCNPISIQTSTMPWTASTTVARLSEGRYDDTLRSAQMWRGNLNSLVSFPEAGRHAKAGVNKKTPKILHGIFIFNSLCDGAYPERHFFLSSSFGYELAIPLPDPGPFFFFFWHRAAVQRLHGIVVVLRCFFAAAGSYRKASWMAMTNPQPRVGCTGEAWGV